MKTLYKLWYDSYFLVAWRCALNWDVHLILTILLFLVPFRSHTELSDPNKTTLIYFLWEASGMNQNSTNVFTILQPGDTTIWVEAFGAYILSFKLKAKVHVYETFLMLFFHRSKFQGVKNNGHPVLISVGSVQTTIFKKCCLEEELYLLIYQLIIMVLFLYPLCLLVSKKSCFLFIFSQVKCNGSCLDSLAHSTSLASESMTLCNKVSSRGGEGLNSECETPFLLPPLNIFKCAAI